MRFTCAKSDLLAAVQVVSRAVPTSTVEQSLLNILLSVKDDQLTLIGSDNRITIRHVMPVQDSEAGDIAILGSLLLDITTQLHTTSSETVSIEVTDNRRVKVNSGPGSNYDMSAFSGESFPLMMKPMEITQSLTLPVEVLRDMIKKVSTITAGSQSGLQAYEESLIDVAGKTLSMVATDSVRLAVCEKVFDDEMATFKVLVPHHALNELGKVMKGSETVRMDLSDDQISFSFGSSELRSRTSEKQFPNFRTIMPKSQKTWVTLNRKEFMDNLRGVLPLVKDSKQKVTIAFEENQIVMTTTSPELGDARRILDVTIEGVPMKLCFNGKYVLDFLNTVDSEQVKFGVTSNTYPGVLTPVQDVQEYTYIVMPITHY